MRRRLVDATVAAYVDARYGDDAMLRVLLNECYFGQAGRRQLIGAQDAARTLFDKSVVELTLAEAALLAGIAPSPNVLSPHRDPERALRRRNAGLERMLQRGLVTRQEYEGALAAPLPATGTPPPP